MRVEGEVEDVGVVWRVAVDFGSCEVMECRGYEDLSETSQ